jgi:hypothetical protein
MERLRTCEVAVGYWPFRPKTGLAGLQLQPRPAPRPFSRDAARLAALLDMFRRGSTVSSHGGVAALWDALRREHPGVDWTGVTPAQVI